jgi:plastocyanin
MQRWYALALGLAVAALLSSSPARGRFDPTPASAAETWEVSVGGDPDEPGFTAIAFLPNVVTINAGDTVSWVFPALEPHTVTFDNGKQPPLFIDGFAPIPETGEFDFTKVVFPVGPVGPNATFDSRQQISSGIPQGPPAERMPFRLTFTQPGVYNYECAVHGPGMAGTINVVPASAPLPETPAQARARGQAKLAKDTQELKNFYLQFVQPGKASLPGGATVHTLAAGAGDAGGMTTLQFLPNTYTVKRGDTVVWSVPDPNEIHTVTFTSGAKNPDFVDVRPQAAGPPMIVIPANVAGPVGGTTYNGQGYLNSGIIFAGNSFALRIDAPAGTYEYLCLVHVDDYKMKATITVTE